MPCLARAPPRQAGALLDMGAYEYTALAGGGKERKGVLEADTPRQLRQQLREKGWAPLAVEEVQQREARGARHRSFCQPRISAGDLSLITRQFATLERSGLPVEEALQALSRQTERPRLKSMMMAVRSRVMEGHTLASSLEDFPHVFPDLYRATVAAGEQSGYLDSVLERLADYTETRQTLQQKTTLVLIYPLLVLVVSLLVVALLMVYVVPQIVQVFEGIGQKRPVLTRALIAVSDFTRSYGLWMLIALVIAVVLARTALREGAAPHTALERSGYFPPMTIHLFACGEASGKLEEMLERAADSQEREMEVLITTITELFGPLLILIMGGMVLVIVLAILLPIFDLNQLVK